MSTHPPLSRLPFRVLAAVAMLAAVFAVQNISFSAWNAAFLATMMVAAALALAAARRGGGETAAPNAMTRA